MAIETYLNKIHNLDAIELLRALPDASVDLIVTSPPYDNLRTYNGYTWNFEAIAQDSYRVLKQGGVLVWIVGDSVIDGSESLTSFEQALYFKKQVGFRMHDTMIDFDRAIKFPDPTRYGQCFEYMFVLSKDKPKTTNLLTELNKTLEYGIKRNSKTQREPDGTLTSKSRIPVHEFGVLRNVWEISSGYMKSTTDKYAYEHPAIMDELIAERHILTWSNPGDIVLDYFGGSGTTAKMAQKNNRRWITGDISAAYCELMEKRLKYYTPNMFETIAALDTR